MYHVSDLKKYLKCPRRYLLERDDNSFVPYLRIDASLSELLLNYFGVDSYLAGQVGDDNDVFLKNIDNYVWFTGIRLNKDGLRVKLPLLEKRADGAIIYFPLYSVGFREPDLLNFKACLDLLEPYLPVKKIVAVYINGDYVYRGSLDIASLLTMTDAYQGEDLLMLTRAYELDYYALMKEIDERVDYSARKCRACHAWGLCRHFYDCFPQYQQIPDNSILTLVSSSQKNELYEQGVLSLEDYADHADLSNRVQYAQIMAAKKGGLYYDALCLKDFLSNLKERPLIFLDFEWDTYLIPKYEGLKPLDVVCFEYAMYILRQDGSLEHHCYIGDGDCREAFICSLLKDLPEDGKIVAYNAKGAEVRRLKELAEQFPAYRQQLLDVAERFVDLAVVFIEGVVYHTGMRGNFSLKNLVDLVSGYSYKDLEISDGMEAVLSYRNIENALAKERQEILQDLEQYCSLDAYGLYLVYRWLLKL